MNAASLSEIKSELKNIPQGKLIELCLHLAKYKKENKELLTYLLFEADDEQSYLESVKAVVIEEFQNINKTNLYFAKKSIRKILRITNKYIKYSGLHQSEVELLIFFCKQLKNSGIRIQSSTALTNLYQRQIQKIEKAVATLHEDLQYDYHEDLKQLK